MLCKEGGPRRLEMYHTRSVYANLREMIHNLGLVQFTYVLNPIVRNVSHSLVRAEKWMQTIGDYGISSLSSLSSIGRVIPEIRISSCECCSLRLRNNLSSSTTNSVTPIKRFKIIVRNGGL